MIYSEWETGDYPILLNPNITELGRLGLWDTLRICVDNDNIGIASGHGNTHDSITHAMKRFELSKGLPETYILFKEGHDFRFNLEDVGGRRSARISPTLRTYFSEEHGNLLRDCIECRRDERIV